MTSFLRTITCFFLSLFFFCFAAGTDLTEQQQKKLHPFFRSLITHPSSASSSHRFAITKGTDGGLLYGVIMYTHNASALRSRGVHVNSIFPDFVTARVTLSELSQLAMDESIQYIDIGKSRKPLLDISVPETGATLVHDGYINHTPYKGSGAIVLIFDTGIDWKHFDFRKASDTTKSRILYIWDQTLTPTGSEASPAGFTYGVEYSKTQIENELNGITKGFIREQDTYGHGTHVASTAAGNGQASNFKYIGMAPESDIIVVKGGNGNFTTDNEIDGLTYAQNKAAALHEPIVVNMSFGGQIGSHDGTDPDEVAINNFVQSAGHVVCVAAGNDGSNAIHINGTLISGSTATYSITVPSYTPTTPVGQENNYFVLDLWLQNTNSISATVTSPSNIVFSSQLNNDVTSPNQADGTIDLYDEIDPQNEHRHLQLSVYDGTSAIPKAGTWTITFSTTASSTPYNAWLESSLNNASAAISNGNTNETVGIPGTSAGAITVASYVTKWFWTDYTGESWQNGPTDRTGNISTFSSIGPTADNRQKPDIAAPGQGIVAAFSSMDSSESTSSVIVKNEYLFMQGTSMACPHVTGASALLLSVKPTITASQVKNYLNSNTTIDSYTSTVWNADWGNGKMNIYKAMASAVGGIGSNQVTLMYNSDTISYYTILPATNQKVAMRFTPTISGNLSSISIEFNSGTSSVAGTGNLIISAAQSIAGSIDGIPGTQIGNSVSVPISSLTQGTVNVIDMTSSNVPVTAGTDFQIVLGTTNSTDSLQLLLDNGSFQIDRTSSYRTGANGVLGWYNRADPNYAKSYTPAYNNLMISTKIASLVTGVQKEGSNVPSSFALEQNYPNPFNPSTKINYQLAAKTQVSLKVYDVLGREVATLIDREQPAGQYQTQWDAKQYSSGIYFITMQTNSYSKTIKMVLLK